MYKRILVPIDGSPVSGKGLSEAVRLAQVAKASLVLLHVIDTVPATSGTGSMRDVLAGIRRSGVAVLEGAKARVASAGLDAETALIDGLSGGAAQSIVDAALSLHADVIVLGTHGRRGVGRTLLGSDAEQVLRTTPVPVMLVPAAANVKL